MPVADSWRLEMAERTVAVFREQDDKLRTTMAALDRSILLLDGRVRPDALATIHAWSGRYGSRGAFHSFMRAALQAAGPTGVTALELVEAAQSTFDLDLNTAMARRKFKLNSIRPYLRRREATGDVERTTRPGRVGPVRTWRGKQAPTLHDLTADADR